LKRRFAADVTRVEHQAMDDEEFRDENRSNRSFQRLWAIGAGIVAGSLLAILAVTILVTTSQRDRLPEITMTDQIGRAHV